MKIYYFSRFLIAVGLWIGTCLNMSGQGVDPILQTKIDALVPVIQAWANDAVIVKAVQAHNASLPPDQAAMTGDQWKTLSILDPFVKTFSSNEAAQFLKSKKIDTVPKVFVNGADGLKVAFLAKTADWNHKGKPKHDLPMTGKNWQGTIEVDPTTGLQQIQISVPVLDNGKPIGSLVAGLSVAKL